MKDISLPPWTAQRVHRSLILVVARTDETVAMVNSAADAMAANAVPITAAPAIADAIRAENIPAASAIVARLDRMAP